MSVVRINMIVEGDTEEAFVKQVLASYLSAKQIFPVARKVTTSRQRRVRGGMTSYGRARNDIERWLKQDTSAHCTTMFDLYGLPSDFPGYETGRRIPDPYARVAHLEAAFGEDIAHGRFIPFFLLHEFEALLLSEPVKLDEALTVLQGSSRLSDLEKILDAFVGPENVNDDPNTAPSKRLLQLYPGYQKILFGVLVAEAIGVDGIRKKCPHFNEWISKLEHLTPFS